MSLLAPRQPRRARHAAPVLALLLGGLLVACDFPGTAPAGPSAARTPSPALATGAEHPRPAQGNAATSGSFGGASTVQTVPLPVGPGQPAQPGQPGTNPSASNPGAPNAAPPANPAGGQVAAPAGRIQTRSIPKDRLNLRGLIVYAGTDGKLLAVGADGKNPFVVLNKPADTGAPGALSDLNLAPDGSRLLYTIDALLPSQRVFLLDMDAATLSQQKYNGAWSPDDKHVVATDNNRLVVTNVETGGVEDLGEGSNANWTSYNAIIAVRSGNIWLLPYPAASGKAQQLTSFPTTGDKRWGFLNRLQYHFANRILFVGAPVDTLGAQANGYGLWSLDIASRRLTQVATPGGNVVNGLALSPSGNQIAWAQQAHSSACASIGSVGWARTEGGQEVTARLPQDDADFYQVNGLTWSPDQRIAFSGREQSCANLTLTTRGPDHIFVVNPAASANPQMLVEGSSPVWVAPRGLGMLGPDVVAQH